MINNVIINTRFKISTIINPFLPGIGAPVAQWVKSCPTDVAVRVRSPLEAKTSQTVNGVPLHKAFHYHPTIVLI